MSHPGRRTPSYLTSVLNSLRSFVLTAALAGLAGAQGPPASPPSPTLRPGDVLQLNFWREPKLSGEYAVDRSGSVVLPILGSRRVSDAPWPVVLDSLVAAFDAQLAPGSVSITPLRRLYVLGSVKSPGVFMADPEISLAGAVAMAGGATSEGDLRRVRIVRDGVTLVARVSVDQPASPDDLRSGDQIYVDRRSWFDRNSAVTLSSLAGFAGVLLTVILLR